MVGLLSDVCGTEFLAEQTSQRLCHQKASVGWQMPPKIVQRD
jgi:hypothetical protein